MLLRLNFARLVCGMLLCAPLPVLAGPFGAVHCQDPTTLKATLSAFDIALPLSPVRIHSFQAKSPLGGQQFQMETSNIQASLLSLTDKIASVRYSRPDGTSARAMVEEFQGSRIADVKQVDFYNDGMDSHGNPIGRVLVQLSEGPTTELVFKGCRYEGALVSDWQQLWGWAQ